MRKQTGDVKKVFDKHEEDFKEKVQRWRAALTRVANLSGWYIQDRHKAILIQDIVKEISRIIKLTLPSIAGEFVGMDSRMEKLKEYLELGSGGVRFIGICGMGGVGKTTLARVAYDLLSSHYDGCSFLVNVREISEKEGLVHLQEKLLSHVLMERDLNISDNYEGINLIRKRLCCKKVFVVLDDVDQLEQLENLAAKHHWFGSGSRIVVTTRDEHLLISHGVRNIYKVKGMNLGEALELLLSKAFKNERPTTDHLGLSYNVINYANGLPLALVVLGSFLCDRTVKEWKSALNRLKQVPDKKNLKILQISYDGLEETEKKIFLDIACFFKGWEKDRVMDILDSCKFYPHIGIKVLSEKSLITISKDTLGMHDLIQKMGWEIVRERNPSEPGKWSRLWRCEDICDVQTKNTGTTAVEGLFLDNHVNATRHLNGKSFSIMNNLRLLRINNVHLSEDLECLSNELRYLEWHGFTSKSLPLSFQAQKLNELDMSSSQIEFLWEDIKYFESLKTIELSGSCKLIRTPDFTGVPKIEKLNLTGCTALAEIHHSIGVLRRLTVLNLKDCKSLQSLPNEICSLKSLEILNLHGCLRLEKLPQRLGEAECLEELDLGLTAITQIPSSIVLLKRLKRLSFHGCRGEQLKSWSSLIWSLLFPKPDLYSKSLLFPSFASFHSLRELNLSNCNLGSIPYDIGCLSSLVELDLSKNNFVSLPGSIKQLSKLWTLCLKKCQRLQSLPELPSTVEYVKAEDCWLLESFVYRPDLHASASNMRLELFNCFKLANNQYKMNLFRVLWQKLQLQMLLGSSVRYEIVLPGNEIRNWFIHERNLSSVTVQLPPNWYNDKLMGLAFYVVFTPLEASLDENPLYLKCTLEFGGPPRRCYGFYGPRNFSIESDHVWLSYFSASNFEYRRPPLNSKYVKARFRNIARRRPPVNSEDVEARQEQTQHCMKRCGVRLVYREDVEDIILLNSIEKLTEEEGSTVKQNCSASFYVNEKEESRIEASGWSITEQSRNGEHDIDCNKGAKYKEIKRVNEDSSSTKSMQKLESKCLKLLVTPLFILLIICGFCSYKLS